MFNSNNLLELESLLIQKKIHWLFNLINMQKQDTCNVHWQSGLLALEAKPRVYKSFRILFRWVYVRLKGLPMIGAPVDKEWLF